MHSRCQRNISSLNYRLSWCMSNSSHRLSWAEGPGPHGAVLGTACRQLSWPWSEWGLAPSTERWTRGWRSQASSLGAAGLPQDDMGCLPILLPGLPGIGEIWIPASPQEGFGVRQLATCQPAPPTSPLRCLQHIQMENVSVSWKTQHDTHLYLLPSRKKEDCFSLHSWSHNYPPRNIIVALYPSLCLPLLAFPPSSCVLLNLACKVFYVSPLNLFTFA